MFGILSYVRYTGWWHGTWQNTGDYCIDSNQLWRRQAVGCACARQDQTFTGMLRYHGLSLTCLSAFSPVWHLVYALLILFCNTFHNFDIICQNLYTASNLKDLFHNIHPKQMISFGTHCWPLLINFKLTQAWYSRYLHAQNAAKSSIHPHSVAFSLFDIHISDVV